MREANESTVEPTEQPPPPPDDPKRPGYEAGDFLREGEIVRLPIRPDGSVWRVGRVTGCPLDGVVRELGFQVRFSSPAIDGDMVRVVPIRDLERATDEGRKRYLSNDPSVSDAGYEADLLAARAKLAKQTVEQANSGSIGTLHQTLDAIAKVDSLLGSARGKR